MKKRAYLILIGIIVIQTIWGSCERRAIEKKYSKHLDDQKKKLIFEMKSLKTQNHQLSLQNKDIMDSIKSRNQKIIYITQNTNEKKSIIHHTTSADSLQQRITDRYR